ncbi:MAG: hypothetical protein IPK79_13225 [Vampirovibrionales bacterium]|nr:hypothetical protein [Vampirovibrionales bacterium]
MEKAIRVRDFVDYYHMRAYAAGIDAVTESLQELLKEGYTQETIDLTEYALSLLEDSLNSMDDSAGYMTGIMETLETLHHDACKQGQPKIEPLVKRLFAWQIRTEWDTFSNVLEDYADVFGKEGISLYRRLAEAEWEKVPALKPGIKILRNTDAVTELPRLWTLWPSRPEISKLWSLSENGICPNPTISCGLRTFTEMQGYLKSIGLGRERGTRLPR